MKDAILERLKSVIAEKSNSASDFSKMIGIAQTTLSNQMKSPRGISIDVIMLTLEQFPDISAEWLLRGNGEMIFTDSLSTYTGLETDSELSSKVLYDKLKTLYDYEVEEHQKLLNQIEYLEGYNQRLAHEKMNLEERLSKYEPKKKDII